MGVIYRRWGMCVGVWVVGEGVAMRISGRMMMREIVRRTSGTILQNQTLKTLNMQVLSC